MSRMVRLRLILLTVIAIGLATAPGAGSLNGRAETGRIVVSLIERPIGFEVFEVAQDESGMSFTAAMDLVERGGRLHVASSMRLAGDLTPISYRSKGNTYRFVNLDVEVDVVGRTARVRRGGEEQRVDLPERFFTAETYAPIAARALLVRYWDRHGRPSTLPVIPGEPARTVSIEERGVDRVRVGARVVTLRRYSVENVVWGRESVWLDEQARFAALTSRIHILPLEAVREDLHEALPALLASSVADRMADLERISGAVKPVATDSFALAGARIVDGTGAPSADDAIVVVRGGRIAAVGPRSTVAVPDGVRVIDASGTTIVPGLWDMHAHASQIEWAGAYLAAGVTTIRDMGGEFGFLTAFRDAIAGGRAAGPRVLLAGLVDGASDRALGAVVAATPEEGRAVVDRYKTARFDQMKLYSLLQADVARAIVDRAHEVGMTVTGHVPTSLGLDGAIEAGMDHIAHSPGGARELAARLAERGIVVDPTMPWGELLGHGPDTSIASFEPGIDRIAAPLRQNYLSVRNQTDAAAFAARQRSNGALVKMLFDAGVPIVVGTDAAVPGFSVLRNVEQLVEAGLTPAQALQAATLVPARAMGLDRDTGTIAVGKRADMLVLDADPLVDIRNIRRSRWVVVAGRMYRTADW